MTFISYAQNFEDVMLWRALRQVEKGHYLDVGAADPTLDSVTRAFYERGWRGINVEPVAEFYRRLVSARPQDINLQSALGAQSGEVHLFVVAETGPLDGGVPRVVEAAQDSGWRAEATTVTMTTLAEICEPCVGKPIHFLKIDVEGAEKEVLAGADFSRHRPWIVVVEATFPATQQSTHAEWEPALLAAGYHFLWFDGLSRFYGAEEHYVELRQHFELPPNVFDDFIQYNAGKEQTIANQAKVIADRDQSIAELHSTLQRTITDLQGTITTLAQTQNSLAQANTRVAEQSLELASIYASRSWRLTKPLRTLSSRLHKPAGYQERSVPPKAPAAIKVRAPRPTIFVECTHTYHSDINTGIQRVVRNILRSAPEVAARHGYDVVPVIWNADSFIHADAARVLANKAVMKNEPQTPQQEPSLTLDNYETQQGNVLLLLDSSWTYDIWPAVKRFKASGGAVSGVIYDLIPIVYPQTCVEPLVTMFRNWLKGHLATTDSLVGISRSTQAQVADFLAAEGAAPGRESAISLSHFHLGAELDFIDPAKTPRPHIQRLFSSGRQTFIVVGTIEPRKNVPFILDAFDELWRTGAQAQLILIGKRDWKSDEFIARVSKHPLLGNRLHFLRDISDEELDFAYRTASALIIASETEGFGLPIVEAFQRGLPVLCSDIPVFREIADGKARFFALEGSPVFLAQAVSEFMKQSNSKGPMARTPTPWLSWAESVEQLFHAVLGSMPHRVKRAALG